MNRDAVTPSHACDKCQCRLTEIDFYGERLKSCIACNVWTDTYGTLRKIPEEDIEALKGLRHTKPA
jgi:hypothetical protein